MPYDIGWCEARVPVIHTYVHGCNDTRTARERERERERERKREIKRERERK